MGKDNQRNQFFLEKNWVVIRFSELQVVKYPDSCCKAIARIISQITGDYRGLVQLQPTFRTRYWHIHGAIEFGVNRLSSRVSKNTQIF